MKELIWLRRPHDSPDSEAQFLVGLGPFSQAPYPFKGQTAFYLPHFFSSTSPCLHAQKVLNLGQRDFATFLAEQKIPTELPELQWEPLGAAQFFEAVLELQELIAQGWTSKGVPVVFEEGQGKLSALTLTLRALKSPLASSNLYGAQLEGRSFVGLSPEILFHKKGSKGRSMALAGTRPLCRRQELATDSKEIEEHEKVVRDILGKLRGLQARRGTREIADFPTLAHLRSEISFAASGEDFESLCEKLHPTAALGVYPVQTRAQDWLKKWTGDRAGFGAPMGFVDDLNDEAFALVAIRQIEIFDRSFRIGSGCGILRESDPLKEWEELKLKRASVKKVFFGEV